jgi:hypothetical protein
MAGRVDDRDRRDPERAMLAKRRIVVGAQGHRDDAIGAVAGDGVDSVVDALGRARGIFNDVAQRTDVDIADFGTTTDGRVFRGARGQRGELIGGARRRCATSEREAHEPRARQTPSVHAALQCSFILILRL